MTEQIRDAQSSNPIPARSPALAESIQSDTPLGVGRTGIRTTTPSVITLRHTRTKPQADRVDVNPREPRCRVCRDETVRILVNKLLDWVGVPVSLGRGRSHRINLVDVLGFLEPLNHGRDPRDKLTYNSLRVHTRRHHDLDGIVDYWERQMHKKLRKALGAKGRRPIE